MKPTGVCRSPQSIAVCKLEVIFLYVENPSDMHLLFCYTSVFVFISRLQVLICNVSTTGHLLHGLILTEQF